jgi:hypothetical protein
VAIFQLPQRLRVVHGSSDTMAGVQTIPFTLSAPLGSAVESILAKKGPVMHVVILSGVLQTIGFALLAVVRSRPMYLLGCMGFQIIAGFACGINISTLLLRVPFVLEYRDKGKLRRLNSRVLVIIRVTVDMAAGTQLRPMGGAIVLAIATSVFSSYCSPQLAEYM